MKLWPFRKQPTNNSANSSQAPSQVSVVDPTPLQHISPQFTAQQEWRDRLQRQKHEWQNDTERRTVNRALDLVEEAEPDPMHVTTRTIHKGVGAAGLVATALAAGLPSGLLAWYLLNQQQKPPAVETKTETWRGAIRLGWKEGKRTVEQLDENGKVIEELP